MTMTPSQALRAPRHPDAGSAGGRAAAFFDLDGTLIPGSANIPLARAAFRAGLVTPPELVRDLRHGVSFLLQGATDERSEAVRDRILAAVTGRSAAEMVALSDDFIPDLVASITPAMRRVLGDHASCRAGPDRAVRQPDRDRVPGRRRGRASSAASGTTSELDADGRYTGRLDGPFCYGATGRPRSCGPWPREHGLRPGGQLRLHATPPATCPCSRRSATRWRSTRSRSCATSPRSGAGRSWRPPGSRGSRWPIARSWVRMGQRLTVASVGSLIALGTRPIEALGGIDGDREDDAPTGDRPDAQRRRSGLNGGTAHGRSGTSRGRARGWRCRRPRDQGGGRHARGPHRGGPHGAHPPRARSVACPSRPRR